MRRTVITALVACLLGAATVGAVSTAATKKSSSKARNAQTAPTTPPPTMQDMLTKRQAARDAMLKKVADALNVSLDDLKAALDGVRDDRIDAAVKANRLTQAQADAIKACVKAPLTCDRSNLPAFGFRQGLRGVGHDRADFFAAVAKKLGKSADDVQKAFQANRPARGMRGPGGHRGPGGPGFRHGGHGMGPGGPGMDQGGPGMDQGGPGMDGPGGAF